MTQVNFYTLTANDSNARFNFACRLAEKAWKLGHSIYIHTESSEQAHYVNDLLWQFRNSSFIPHSLVGEKQEPASRLVIGCETPTVDMNDVLINLSDGSCEAHLQFSRVNEIVSSDEISLQQGRVRYRFFKERGHTPETHKL